jgi:hypothetical protein
MQKQFQPFHINLGASYSPARTIPGGLVLTSGSYKDAPIRTYVLIVLLGTILAGCATPGAEYQQAKSSNTVPAYEHFIKEHPRSEYADQARANIENLKQKQAVKEKYRLAAIAKLKAYTPNVTKEQQFFADGWNIRDVIYGRVGILSASVKVDNLDLTLGFVEDFHSLFWQTTSPTMNMSLVEELSSYNPKMGEVLLANVVEARKNRKFYTVQYHFYKAESDTDTATQLCTLRFKRGTLTAVEWKK